MTTPEEFVFMRPVGPDFALGFFAAKAETAAPAIEVECDPSIEGDLLRLADWFGYRRVEQSAGKALFNLREPPRLSQILAQWD